MKKIISLLIALIFMASCGPKRMSCYGKRCVEATNKSNSDQKPTS